MSQTPGGGEPRDDGGPMVPGGWSSPAETGRTPQGPGYEVSYGQAPYSPGGYGRPQAVKPGIVALRPLGLGELYDGAFQAIRRNPSAMLGTAAVVMLVVTVLDTIAQLASAGRLIAFFDELDSEVPDCDALVGAAAGLATYSAVSTALQLLGVAVLTGLLILVVSRAVLGQRMSGGQMWAATRRRVPALIGLILLILAVTLVLTMACLVPGLLALTVSDALGGALLVLGVLAGVVVLVLTLTRLSMAVPALLLEEAGVPTALRRSWGLVRGSFWRVLGILLLTGLITVFTLTIITVPFALVSGGLSFLSPDDPRAAMGLAAPQLLLSGIGSVIAATIVYPFTSAVIALLYIDLRMRREGLDVELARAAASPTA